MNRPDWYDDALCAQVGYTDLWFPEKGGSTADAKRVCAACPALALCREYAIERPELVGVWGATSERERRTLRTDAGLERDCGHCGEPFDPERTTRKYCSDECRIAVHNEQVMTSHRRKAAA